MSSPHDPLEQLRKLAALRSEGIVDDAEFAQLKQQLLSQAVAGNSNPSVPTVREAAAEAAPHAGKAPPVHRVTETQVAELHQKFVECDSEFSALQTQKLGRTDRANKLQRRLRHLDRLTWARSLVQNVALAPWGPILVCTGVGMFVGLVFLELVSNIPGAMFFGGLSGGLIAFLLSLHVFLIPYDSNIALEKSAKSAELINLQTVLARDEPAFVDAGAKLNAVRRQHDLVLSEFKSARNHFLSVDWRSMRGEAFENFLAKIFEHLGYRCRLTAKTGDQGVDLIVEKNGVRIAVQSKAYTASVGNDAVQQAYAGMKYYGCNQCAVITNSRFTRAANDLARSNDCKLIDETQIESLITGEVGF